MRAERGGTGKLKLAFHFQYGNPAGWECASCRRSGLARQRRCARMPETEREPERVIWARKRVAASRCPKSLITAESLAWLEAYLVRRRLGGPPVDGLPAREVEAYLVFERELAAEMEHA